MVVQPGMVAAQKITLENKHLREVAAPQKIILGVLPELDALTSTTQLCPFRPK